jgi:hypothetical protein
MIPPNDDQASDLDHNKKTKLNSPMGYQFCRKICADSLAEGHYSEPPGSAH